MGFLGVDEAPAKRGQRMPKKQPPTLETLHRMGCQICPLGVNGRDGTFYSTLKHPQMPAHGSKHPRFYMLGEAPGKHEDRQGRPFVGPAGQCLQMRIPDWVNNSYLRWNNVVRTRPPGNHTPEFMEIECCRPSVEQDIEEHQPFAIFGFGNVPLQWMIGEKGILNWTGRCLPVRVGKHACWFFPIVHPSAILRGRKWDPRTEKDYGSDAEFAFAKDIERAFETVESYWADEYLPQPHTREDALADLELIDGSRGDDLQDVLNMLEHCRDTKTIGFDYETQHKRPFAKGAKLLTVGLATHRRAMAIALHHHEAKWSPEQREQVLDALEDFLFTAPCLKAVHNLAFEQEWTAETFGLDSLRAGKWGCTMMQAYTLDERRGALSLEFLCQQYFGINIKALAPPMNYQNMDSEPLAKVLPYQAVDARYHRLLFLEQRQRLLEDGTTDFYEQLLRRVPTMVLTQIKGIPVHQPTVRRTYGEWLAKRTAVEEDINTLPVVKLFAKREGKPFRPSATTDIKKALKLLGIIMTSVDEEDLLTIKDREGEELAGHILKWREAHKIISTYVLPVLDDPAIENAGSALFPDGRMHPVTTLHKTRTSRSASEDTNYQNWPKRENKEIRSMVKVRRHWKLCAFDYGQIQARNVAMESLDKALIKAFWDRYDIHHDWTDKISRVYPRWMQPKGGVEAVRASKGTKEDNWKYYRDIAKNKFVFPSFFGAQAPTLSGYLHIPEDVVGKLHRQFWEMFPSIKAWQERLIADYRANGYTTSLAGHRRHAPVSQNEIINAPIQADEAEIVCNAMARLSELGRWEFQANMEIHDDLTFMWPAEDVEENAKVVIEHMIKVPHKWAQVVPIVVEFSIGDDWGIKHEVGNYASDTWKGSLGIDAAKRDELFFDKLPPKGNGKPPPPDPMTDRDVFGEDIQPLFENGRNAEWLRKAREIAIDLCEDSGEANIDDIRRLHPPPEDCDPRIMGAVFRTRDFEIVSYSQSPRETSHRRRVATFKLRGRGGGNAERIPVRHQ